MDCLIDECAPLAPGTEPPPDETPAGETHAPPFDWSNLVFAAAFCEETRKAHAARAAKPDAA